MAVPIVVPLAVVGGLLALALSGGGGDADAVRPVVPLQTKKEKKAGRTAMCVCYRGGAQEFYALIECSLRSIYPDADNEWRPLIDRALDDSADMDAGTRKAIKWVRARATGLLKLQTEEERAVWCGEDEPDDGPDDILPPPPPPVDRIERVRELFLGSRSDSPAGASFWTPVAGDPDSQGLLRTARATLRSYGIGSPSNAQQVAYAKAMERVGYNQKLYGRTKKSGESIHYQGKTIRSLYLPRHADAAAAIMAGDKPARTIYDNGNKISGSGGNRYGTPWLPGLDEGALAEGIVLVDPTLAEPPAELLQLLRPA